MHTYSFALLLKSLAPERYIVFIESPTKFDDIAVGSHADLEILHGSTPAAPTVMTHTLGKAIRDQDVIRIESDVVKASLNRQQLLKIPIPWVTVVDGVACDVAIHYGWIDD